MTQLQGIRERLGMTQTAMATFLGLGLRAYQEIEAGRSVEREAYVNAAELLSMMTAVSRADVSLASAFGRKLALDLARLITG